MRYQDEKLTREVAGRRDKETNLRDNKKVQPGLPGSVIEHQPGNLEVRVGIQSGHMPGL